MTKKENESKQIQKKKQGDHGLVLGLSVASMILLFFFYAIYYHNKELGGDVKTNIIYTIIIIALIIAIVFSALGLS